MKIRNGFVSNSSSSSFCIYGAYLDFDELVEKVKASNLLTEEKVEELEENDEWYELEEIIGEKTNLEVYSSDDSYWVGRSWSSIDDDETGRQFKESVKADIEKVFGPDIDCSTHEEEIYN